MAAGKLRNATTYFGKFKWGEDPRVKEKLEALRAKFPERFPEKYPPPIRVFVGKTKNEAK